MRFRVAAFVLALGWFFACCACAEGDVSSEILEYALQARADLSAVGQGLDARALFPEAGEFGGREAALIDFLSARKMPGAGGERPRKALGCGKFERQDQRRGL